MNKKKILVIDDEFAVVEMLSSELGSQGYEVLTASRASEGLICLRSQQVDLLITDIRTPGDIDGVDLVRIFRKDKPYLKVIFMTAYEVDEKLQKILKTPYTLLLTKPFNLDELSKRVSEILAS